MIYIRAGLGLRQRPQVKTQADALRKLNKLTRIQLVIQLRLARQDDPKDFFLRRLDARQHAQLFEHAVAQILRLIDDQQDFPAIDVLFHQELVQRRQDLRFLHVEGGETELHQDRLQKLRRRQLSLVYLRDDHVALQFSQECFDQRGFAGTDFARDHHEPVGEPDRRLHVRFGARVLFAEIKELRVRAQAERQLAEFEEF